MRSGRVLKREARAPGRFQGLRRRLVQQCSRQQRCRASNHHDLDEIGSLDTSYLVGQYELAESACYLSAIILTALPDILLMPLMPADSTIPSFALPAACAAARIEAACLVLLGSFCSCLAAASKKNNLTKSDTYKRLNLVALLTATGTSAVVLSAYFFGTCMTDPLLLFAISLATVPATVATLGGLQAQGLATTNSLTRRLSKDSGKLLKSCTTIESPSAPLLVFYRSQMILSLLVGAVLLVAPNLVWNWEGYFSALPMLRHSSALTTALALATANWLLLGAASRDRLGASTFTQLNWTVGIVDAAIGFWLAWILPQCTYATQLEAAPVALLGMAPAAVYLYQGYVATAARKA